MKISIAVLFGGKSTEHEISIISALQAIENMDKEKYNIYPIYISKNNEFYYDKELLYDIKNYKNMSTLLQKLTKVCLVREDSSVYIKSLKTKLFSNNNIAKVDVAFPIVHGTNVEDGNLQGYLRTLGLAYAESDCISSALGMDKYLMKQILKSENIPVLEAIKIDMSDYKKPDDTINMLESKISYPMIVKPINLGSSIGISKAKDREKLKDALSLAFSFSEIVLVERAIVNLREINCAVLGDKYEQRASALEEPFGKDEILSFQDKYMSGGSKKTGKVGANANKAGTNQNYVGAVSDRPHGESQSVGANQNYVGAKQCEPEQNGMKFANSSQGMASLQRQIPANVDKDTEVKIKNYAMRTFKALGCSGVARIDLMIDKDSNDIYVNEINTIPGSLSYYLWAAEGISYKALLDRIIKIAIDNKRRDEMLNFTFDSNVLA